MEQTASYSIVPSFDSESFIKLRLQLVCDGPTRHVNPKYYFTKSAIDLARGTVANMPILVHTYFDEDGNPVFGGHDMHLEIDGNENLRLIYDEIPIGLVPETCSYAVEEHDGKNFVCVDAYVWRKYANYALDVLLEREAVGLSIEITVDDQDYDVESDISTVNRFSYTGITLLGDDMVPAVSGAKATIDCAKKQHTEEYETIRRELSVLLNSATADNTEEVETVDENKQEVTATEETTAEESTAENASEETTNEQEEEAVVEEQAEETEEKEETEQKPEEEETEKDTKCALGSVLNSALANAVKGLCDPDNGVYFDLVDVDEAVGSAYVINWSDGQYYKCTFTVNGDSVTLNSNLVRQVICYRDAVSGEAPANTMTGFAAIAEQARKTEALTQEVEVLNSKLSAIETEKKVTEIQAAAGEFADLAELDEFKTLLNSASEIADVETFKEKCFALRGKHIKPEQLVASAGKTTGLRVPLPLNNTESKATDVLSRMIQAYKK